MPLIHVLPEHLRNVIAAGEVIERPASVVKELIENSIDAGARKIKIEVLYGGKKLIKVTDDGCGMDREDALLSVQRYATSKIASIEDLFKLKTLGFRGEALASIAAVSRLTIETGTDQTGPATFIEVIGGEVKSVKDAPPLKGTIVTVRDLFFNTPARRKFLRANSTELNHIIEIIIMEALSDFSRDYKLFADDTEILFFPPVYEPRERITQVFGMETIEHMLEFESRSEDMRFQAFISKPPELRAKRTGQYIFINQRPVRDYLISKAIYDGLGSLLSKDKHPLFVVYLSIPPSKVDFNVHPTKREVRFSEGVAIYDFVRVTVEEGIKKVIDLSLGVKERQDSSDEGSAQALEEIRVLQNFQTSSSVHPSTGFESSSDFTGLRLFERDSTYEAAQPFIFFGEVFIAMPAPDGLLIM
ncbi:MAG: DNA mismatch repair endonuclease MutL, partial [Thermodesulfovibrionales bacterium]